MEAARPPRRRRRPRRGTVDRPVNARLVRVAAIVVAPAFIAFLFSVSTTGALPRSQLEPLFDASSAGAKAVELSTLYPSRVPGTPEAENAATWYAQTIGALGLTTTEDVWREDVPGLGKVELRNVVTVVPGRSQEAIVLVAHRDNSGAGQSLGDNASGTAALVELARGFAPQEAVPAPLPQRTLALVSTDAGAFGAAGVARFLKESPYAGELLAAIVLDGLGGRGQPRLAVAGSRPNSPARALVGTAQARIEEEVGDAPALPSLPTQLLDLGIPYGAGEQGPFLADGVAAITITTEEPGDPHVPAGDPPAPLDLDQLGRLGRATEALVSSIDASVRPAFRAPDSLFLGGRAGSGWTVRLTLIAAVAPFALGVLDLLVRNRRRRLPLTPAVRSLGTRVLFWLYAGCLLWVAGITDVLPSGSDLAVPPYSSFLDDWPIAGLAVLGIALAAGWLVARRRLFPAGLPTREERLAGYTVALSWLGVIALAVAMTKPYALVFLLPSLYAWLWLPVQRRLRVRAPLYALGLVGPLAGLFVLDQELDLGPFDTMLYVAGLATVGYVSLWSVLLAIGWASAAAQLAALAFGRYGAFGAGTQPQRASVRDRAVELARAQPLRRSSRRARDSAR